MKKRLMGIVLAAVFCLALVAAVPVNGAQAEDLPDIEVKVLTSSGSSSLPAEITVPDEGRTKYIVLVPSIHGVEKQDEVRFVPVSELPVGISIGSCVVVVTPDAPACELLIKAEHKMGPEYAAPAMVPLKILKPDQEVPARAEVWFEEDNLKASPNKEVTAQAHYKVYNRYGAQIPLPADAQVEWGNDREGMNMDGNGLLTVSAGYLGNAHYKAHMTLRHSGTETVEAESEVLLITGCVELTLYSSNSLAAKIEKIIVPYDEPVTVPNPFTRSEPWKFAGWHYDYQFIDPGETYAFRGTYASLRADWEVDPQFAGNNYFLDQEGRLSQTDSLAYAYKEDSDYYLYKVRFYPQLTQDLMEGEFIPYFYHSPDKNSDWYEIPMESGWIDAMNARGYLFKGYTVNGVFREEWEEGQIPLDPAITNIVKVEWEPVEYTVFLIGNAVNCYGPREVYHGQDYQAHFMAAHGYNLPDSITVHAGREELTQGTDYFYDKEAGTLAIRGEAVKGDIEVEINGVMKSYPVTFRGENLSFDGADTVECLGGYQAEFKAATGYEVPETIRVLVNGEEAGEQVYSYQSSSSFHASLQLRGTQIDGPVEILADGVLGMYPVVFYLNNATANGADQAIATRDYTCILIPDEGYELPESILVLSGSFAVADEDYSYDPETGEVTVYSRGIKGLIEIACTCTAILDTDDGGEGGSSAPGDGEEGGSSAPGDGGEGEGTTPDDGGEGGTTAPDDGEEGGSTVDPNNPETGDRSRAAFWIALMAASLAAAAAVLIMRRKFRDN